jgi:hypothetical protein
VRDHVVAGEFDRAGAHDERDHALSVQLIVAAHDLDLCDPGEFVEDALDLGRVDVLSAG